QCYGHHRHLPSFPTRRSSDLFDGAAEAIEPTGQSRRFCTDYTARLFACGSFYPADTCDHEFAMFTGAYIDRFAACLNLSSCEDRSEEHTSELQSLTNLVCRLL